MATTTSQPKLDERPQVAVKTAKGTEAPTRPSRLDAALGAVSDAATAAGSIATDATTRLPGAAATTRAAFDDANLRIRASSDELLRLGTALSFGIAAGLLIAGANRVLVAVAMVPVGMLGLAMLERWSGSSRSAVQGD
jgi:hypothetical protein